MKEVHSNLEMVQRVHGFRKIFKVNCRVSVFLVDETAVNVAGKLAWVWVAYEPYSKKILGFWLSRTRNFYEAELFLRSLVKLHGRHVVYTDSALFYIEACRSLNLVHRTYEFGDWFFELIERQVQVLKDRTENFDDYFPCSKKVCRLDHVWRWLNLFHLFNQEEVIKIVQKLRGMIV
ncbi:MAG: IS6 family transposase [Thaumarchaeota archaeon]|nr:IS6 family transposase [Nitrososphaerota archaeon]